MNLQRMIGLVAAEQRHISSVLRSCPCLASKVSGLVGIAYLVGPVDFVPATVTYYGHADEAVVLLASLIAARLLLPPAEGGGDPRVSGLGSRMAARWRADLLTAFLLTRRNLFRAWQKPRAVPHRGTGLAAGTDDARDLIRPDLRVRAFRALGYRMWWRLRCTFAPRVVSPSPIIVIGGAARSGTTLLRTMLGRHPCIASCPETTVFLHRISSPAAVAERMGWDAADIERWQIESRSQVDFIERFRSAVLQRSGKSVWAEKTPHNVGRFAFVRRRFPNAKLVHIVRDGRDTVCSLRRKPFAKLDGAAWDSVAAARRCAVQWRNSVWPGLRFRGDPAYYELRYEDLVHRPEPTLRALLRFIDVAWDGSVLLPQSHGLADPDEIAAASDVFSASTGRWRRDLPEPDQRAVQHLIGPLQEHLGYQMPAIRGRGALAANSIGRET